MAMDEDKSLPTIMSSMQLRDIAAELEKFAGDLRTCADVAEKQPGGCLAVYYFASIVAGLKRSKAFVNAANESRMLATLGTPVKEGQRKPRSNRDRTREETKAKRSQMDREAQEFVSSMESTKKKRKSP